MPSSRLPCEFALIRYVPDVVKGEFVNIGVVLRPVPRQAGDSSAPAAEVRFTRDWARVRCMDAAADIEMLESLEAEMIDRLRGISDHRVLARPILDLLGDTLSNSLQITPLSATLVESLPAGMEQLLRMYVEPLRAPAAARKGTGRSALVATMRTEFERAGVWRLMQKRISAALYTEPGDPLKIDCGYQNGRVRMFQAVSLDSDAEAAKALAFSSAALRTGVARVQGKELELTAIIEPIRTVSDADQYQFGVAAMERAEIRVLTSADLGRVAETAKRELHA